MWQCTRCRETSEDNFDVCWNCGTSKDGTEDPAFARAEDAEPDAEETTSRNQPISFIPPARKVMVRKWGPPVCPTCGQQSLYVKQEVPAGSGDGIYLLPGLGELFYYATFDVVICASCGHTRFFASEDARRKLPDSNWTRLES
jgi:hypothetical protein